MKIGRYILELSHHKSFYIKLNHIEYGNEKYYEIIIEHDKKIIEEYRIDNIPNDLLINDKLLINHILTFINKKSLYDINWNIEYSTNDKDLLSVYFNDKKYLFIKYINYDNVTKIKYYIDDSTIEEKIIIEKNILDDYDDLYDFTIKYLKLDTSKNDIEYISYNNNVKYNKTQALSLLPPKLKVNRDGLNLIRVKPKII